MLTLYTFWINPCQDNDQPLVILWKISQNSEVLKIKILLSGSVIPFGNVSEGIVLYTLVEQLSEDAR
jgi:hypothetical protein